MKNELIYGPLGFYQKKQNKTFCDCCSIFLFCYITLFFYFYEFFYNRIIK